MGTHTRSEPPNVLSTKSPRPIDFLPLLKQGEEVNEIKQIVMKAILTNGIEKHPPKLHYQK